MYIHMYIACIIDTHTRTHVYSMYLKRYIINEQFGE